MYADHAGFMAFVEYDYLDQSHNWSGSSSAPAADNADKAIRSSFMTVGGQYQFDRSWGLTIEVPYWNRYFQTTEEDTGAIVEYTHAAMGDIRDPNFDADTQIGSGSTDLLLGGYHLGRLSADNRWTYFLQGQWDQPVWHHENYRPGTEGVVATGVYFEGWSTHADLKFSPVGQVRAVYRRPDGGADGLPDDTGYTRLLISPGIEVAKGNTRVYADVAVPLYTNARGNQLFANEMWKLNASYYF